MRATKGAREHPGGQTVAWDQETQVLFTALAVNQLS